MSPVGLRFFFFNDTATTEIYTLSLHDALPISEKLHMYFNLDGGGGRIRGLQVQERLEMVPVAEQWLAPFRSDRKSTRLNSSHANISYAVFCLKKTNQPPVAPSPYSQPYTRL